MQENTRARNEDLNKVFAELGIGIQAIKGKDGTERVQIAKITNGSLATAVKIQPNTVITHFNGRAITDMASLQTAVAGVKEAGSKSNIAVQMVVSASSNVGEVARYRVILRQSGDNKGSAIMLEPVASLTVTQAAGPLADAVGAVSQAKHQAVAEANKRHTTAAFNFASAAHVFATKIRSTDAALFLVAAPLAEAAEAYANALCASPLHDVRPIAHTLSIAAKGVINTFQALSGEDHPGVQALKKLVGSIEQQYGKGEEIVLPVVEEKSADLQEQPEFQPTRIIDAAVVLTAAINRGNKAAILEAAAAFYYVAASYAKDCIDPHTGEPTALSDAAEDLRQATESFYMFMEGDIATSPANFPALHAFVKSVQSFVEVDSRTAQTFKVLAVAVQALEPTLLAVTAQALEAEETLETNAVVAAQALREKEALEALEAEEEALEMLETEEEALEAEEEEEMRKAANRPFAQALDAQPREKKLRDSMKAWRSGKGREADFEPGVVDERAERERQRLNPSVGQLKGAIAQEIYLGYGEAVPQHIAKRPLLRKPSERRAAEAAIAAQRAKAEEARVAAQRARVEEEARAVVSQEAEITASVRAAAGPYAMFRNKPDSQKIICTLVGDRLSKYLGIKRPTQPAQIAAAILAGSDELIGGKRVAAFKGVWKKLYEVGAGAAAGNLDDFIAGFSARVTALKGVLANKKVVVTTRFIGADDFNAHRERRVAALMELLAGMSHFSKQPNFEQKILPQLAKCLLDDHKAHWEEYVEKGNKQGEGLGDFGRLLDQIKGMPQLTQPPGNDEAPLVSSGGRTSL